MPFDGDARRFSRPERQPRQTARHHHYMAVAMAAGLMCWGVVTVVMATLTLLFADTERALWFFGAAVVQFGFAILLAERQVAQLWHACRHMMR